MNPWILLLGGFILYLFDFVSEDHSCTVAALILCFISLSIFLGG